MIYKNNLKSFPCGLNKNTKLKKVLIVNSGLAQIDSSFARMENIQTLILDKNKFEKFPKEIFELKTLKELSLRENLLKSLPEDIIRITGLEILDLTGNEIPKSQIEIVRILLPKCRIMI
jgi:Leucine-rich repeat (LRR) protein